MKRTSTARQIFSTSSIMLTVPMILAPLDIKKPESKPLQSMRISFPLRKWKMPKIRSSENITFRTQKSTVHSIGRPRLTENYPIHTEPGKGYLVVILSLNVRALNKNLFPLYDVEMLIFNIIYSSYHWRGTILGYDSLKLVVANYL